MRVVLYLYVHATTCYGHDLKLYQIQWRVGVNICVQRKMTYSILIYKVFNGKVITNNTTTEGTHICMYILESSTIVRQHFHSYIFRLSVRCDRTYAYYLT